MGDIFLLEQNQCHSTRVKKSDFGHSFHLRPKKVSWWAGGGWKFTLVSVCVNFFQKPKIRYHTDTKWTQSLTISFFVRFGQEAILASLKLVMHMGVLAKSKLRMMLVLRWKKDFWILNNKIQFDVLGYERSRSRIQPILHNREVCRGILRSTRLQNRRTLQGSYVSFEGGG